MNCGPLLRVAQITTDARGTLVPVEQSTPAFGTAPEALLQGFSMCPDEVEVHVISCVPKPVNAPEKLASNIYFHSLVVPMLGWRAGFLGCALAVRRRLRTIRPDVVHGQGTERDCAMGAVFSGAPNFLTIHGNMQRLARMANAPPFSYAWIVARLERFVLPRTNGVICITRHTESEVNRFVRRHWLVPNAVDRTFFSVVRQPAKPPVAVCIASIGALKNQNELIRALDPIGVKNSFILAFHGVHGSDTYGETFRRLIEERSWCQYRGFAPRADLKRILAEATMLILPSLEENCPMVVLEAMAAGVPVLASNVGGIPDLIEHGVTGMLFDPANASSIRAAVQEVLENPGLRQNLAAKAKASALSRFQPEIIARRHLQIYREMLNRAD
jgi:glycosyltransferase involved in cell wall biosynthesis